MDNQTSENNNLTFQHYRSDSVSVIAVGSKEDRIPTRWNVREAVAYIVEQTLQYGMNPYEQAEEARKWDGIISWTANLPHPQTQEELEDPQTQEELVDWIMETEQMNTALQIMNMGGVMQSEVTPEEMEEKDVSTILLGILTTEHD